jgi:hypothetical protein
MLGSGVGVRLGALVGALVGLVGAMDGAAVGAEVGEEVGALVALVGWVVGAAVGNAVASTHLRFASFFTAVGKSGNCLRRFSFAICSCFIPTDRFILRASSLRSCPRACTAFSCSFFSPALINSCDSSYRLFFLSTARLLASAAA